jgi:DNA ligase 1
MKNLTVVADIIKQVKETSGKKDKEHILSLHKDNTLLGEVLNHIFNPYIKTNIAKKKLSKEVKTNAIFPATLTVNGYMDRLSKSTGKDEDIAFVQGYIASQSEDVRWLLEAMAIKSLKIGATASTINKAFGEGFIPTFDVMLAEKYVEVKTVKVKGVPTKKLYEHWKRYIGKRVIATKKLDGNRCAVFVRDNGQVTLYTREGHVMEGYIELEEAFATFPRGFVYDGEVLATNEEGLNSQDLFKKTSKIVKKKGEKKGLLFHAFDVVPIADFEKGIWEETCEKRKEGLEKLISLKNHPLIHYVPIIFAGMFDKEVIDRLAEEAKANGEEGIMVQLADAPYQCKRTFDIIKVKTFESADILCLDVYEGKAESTEGKLGGVVLDFKGNRVNIGGGFSAEQRIEYWEDPSKIIGKIVEIQYFEEFYDKDTGELDLRFATFKTVRDDKTEPSYY